MPASIPLLPLDNIEQWETRAVLKKVAEAHRYLAELKGIAASIPNEAILINTLALQEAKDSSEVENIVTTHDELYKANLFEEAITSVWEKILLTEFQRRFNVRFIYIAP